MTDSPVKLALTTTLTSAGNAAAMGEMYLPDDDIGNRWQLENFTWIPSDASLAAMPFPLAPDADEIDFDDYAGGPAAYYAQAVLADIPEEINPGGDGQGFIGGTLAGVELRIVGGEITIDLAIARRIPEAWFSAPMFAVSYDDIATAFPGVDYDDVDPAISYYDARLAHP